ncbi:MAG: STAS domain-containing protein [Alphaproteobacteria bacterium]|nr:STAS domain-containing protein [Alphaproteobacteria bacterium]
MVDSDIRIERSVEDGAPVVHVFGRIISSVVDKIETAVNSELEKSNSVTLDFQGVDFMASAGIRLLLTINNKIEQKQGKLVLRHLNDVVLEVLKMMGLTTFLTIQ